MIYLYQRIITELKIAAEMSPEECCGFLFGSENNDQRIITAIMHAKNEAEDRGRNFKISANDYMAAEAFSQYKNLQLLGIFHSHPDHPAIPSEYDRVAAQPFFSYVIIGVKDEKVDDVRSWRLNSNFKFEEESLSIISANQSIYGYRNHPNTAA